MSSITDTSVWKVKTGQKLTGSESYVLWTDFITTKQK